MLCVAINMPFLTIAGDEFLHRCKHPADENALPVFGSRILRSSSTAVVFASLRLFSRYRGVWPALCLRIWRSAPP